MIENKAHAIPTKDITIPKNRQRKEEPEEAYIEELSDSIHDHGLFHPIVLNRSNELVIGYCRLKAWKRLETIFASAPEEGFSGGIPARYTDEIDPVELHAMELQENIQRRDLSWQDASVAFLEFYEAKSKLEEEGDEYTYAQMGGELGCSKTHCVRMVTVGRAVRAEDKEVLTCQSARAAGALLDRRINRKIQNELVTFGQADAKPKTEPQVDLSTLGVDLGEKPEGEIDLDSVLGNITLEDIAAAEADSLPYSIQLADFKEWIDSYEGPRFNFVHCDFPYGIGLHKSELYKTGTKDLTYDDSEDLFEELCSTLVYATEDVLSASCHIMFWFPMSKYYATKKHFETHGFWVEPYPLFWGKSDKMGILPDPTRGPRRIYETAFIMSLGDRKIIRPTVNAVWASSESRDKEHASQKSQVMLEDFFRMFVDEDSIVLDPTCGSGTALAAALKLGADKVVGLDINPECVRIAEDNCRNTHTLMLQGAE